MHLDYWISILIRHMLSCPGLETSKLNQIVANFSSDLGCQTDAVGIFLENMACILSIPPELWYLSHFVGSVGSCHD